MRTAVEGILGEPQWESFDYGDDWPYWLLENDTVYVTVEAGTEGKRPLRHVTRVILEHDPNGFKK